MKNTNFYLIAPYVSEPQSMAARKASIHYCVFCQNLQYTLVLHVFVVWFWFRLHRTQITKRSIINS